MPQVELLKREKIALQVTLNYAPESWQKDALRSRLQQNISVDGPVEMSQLLIDYIVKVLGSIIELPEFTHESIGRDITAGYVGDVIRKLQD